MFAKRVTEGGREDAERKAASDDKHTLSAALEERDATIVRLERTLADERVHLATLHESLEQARFKAEILEKSYSTQLSDARKRAGTAEQSLADLQACAVEIEAGREEQAKLLTESRDALERMTADRDRLLALLEPTGGPESVVRGRGGARILQAQSIDDMLAGLEAPRDRPIGGGRGGTLGAEAEAPQDVPLEEMLPPELMLTRKSKT